MGHKMFNYIESGLPVIVTKELEAMANIVKKYQIGICVEYKDIKRLKETLKNIDYEKLQKNVKRAQENLSIGKITKELENFYEEIIKNGKTKNNIRQPQISMA